MSARTLAALSVLLTACDHGTYLLVHVEGNTALTISALEVTAMNAGQTAHNGFEPGAPFSLPQSLSLTIDANRSGDIGVGVVALDAAGHDLAKGTGTTTIVQNGVASLNIVLTPDNSGMDMAAASPNLAMPDLRRPVLVWSVQDSPSSDDLHHVWCSGSTAFAVGEDAFRQHGTILATSDSGKTWALSFTAMAPLFGAWGAGPRDVYAVGDLGTALHFDGLSWTTFLPASDNIWLAMAGPTNELYLAGETQTGGIIYGSTDGWSSVGTQYQAPRMEYNAVSATPGNAYAVNSEGSVLRSTDRGKTWTTQTAIGPSLLYGVWTRTNETWVVGANGTILHASTGGAFSAVPSGVTTDLEGIWCGEADCIAVGTGGTILHYDGATWRQENAQTSQVLFGVFATDTDVYAVGNKGTILHASLQ